MRNASQGSATLVAGVLHGSWLRLRGAAKAARPSFIVICLCALSSLPAQTMADGSALVTSRHGGLTATDATGERVSVKAHDVLQPNGLEIATQDNGQIFLTFSNGVAIGLDTSSQVKCLQYKQRPFSKKNHTIGFEPSISELQLVFEQGQIAIASNRFSPLSELRIQLPNGELRIHKGTCLIRVDSLGLHITAFEGNLTYYYSDSDEREFISAPAGVRISEQSAARNNIAERFVAESLPAEATRLCQAAQYASQRVFFEANDTTGLPPRPVLIVSPDYFLQPSFRPYQFED